MSSEIAANTTAVAEGLPSSGSLGTTVDDEAYEPTYAEAFPPLPITEADQPTDVVAAPPAPVNKWTKNMFALRTSTVTQVSSASVLFTILIFEVCWLFFQQLVARAYATIENIQAQTLW